MCFTYSFIPITAVTTFTITVLGIMSQIGKTLWSGFTMVSRSTLHPRHTAVRWCSVIRLSNTMSSSGSTDDRSFTRPMELMECILKPVNRITPAYQWPFTMLPTEGIFGIPTTGPWKFRLVEVLRLLGRPKAGVIKPASNLHRPNVLLRGWSARTTIKISIEGVDLR